MIDHNTITPRQRLVLTGLVGVSPLFQQLPGRAAALAGEAGWLVPLMGVLPLSLLGLLLFHLLRRCQPGEGLGEAVCRCARRPAGRGLLLLWGLWGLLLAGSAMRSGAERFRWAVYPESNVTVFLLVMGLLGYMAAAGSLRGLGRFGEVLLPFLLLGFGLVFLPGLLKGEYALLGVSPAALPGAAMGALDMVNSLCPVVFAALLPGLACPKAKGWVKTMGALGLLGLVLVVVTVTRLGAPLTAALPYPFFLLLRDMGLFRVVERAEALICAQWVFTDFLLTAVLLRGGCRCLGLGLRGRGISGRWLPAAGALLAVGVAYWAPEVLWELAPRLQPLVVFLPLGLVWLVGLGRRRV